MRVTGCKTTLLNDEIGSNTSLQDNIEPTIKGTE